MLVRTLASRRLFSSAATAAAEIPAVTTYSKPLRWLHWVQAFGVIGAIGSVNAAQNQPKTPEGNKAKADIMFAHKSLGTFVLLTFPLRFLARVATKAPPHLPIPAVFNLGAAATHLALYGGMLFMGATGVGMAYASGKPLPFFFTSINVVANPPQPDNAKQLYSWHKRVGFWWQFLVPLHVGGAVLHVAQGHKIMARMNPFI